MLQGMEAARTEMKRLRGLSRLIIADDHPLFRGALREALSGMFDEAEIAEADCFDEITKLLDRGAEVDLILLDLSMPGVRGFSGLLYLRGQYPSVPIIVVSGNDDPAVVRRCMEFGASGFIPKTLGVEVMRTAIDSVLQGHLWTPPDVSSGGAVDAQTAVPLSRLSSLTPQQVRSLDDVIRRFAEQADSPRARRLGGDGEGARVRDLAEARGREPYPSGNRGVQDRAGPVAAMTTRRPRARCNAA